MLIAVGQITTVWSKVILMSINVYVRLPGWRQEVFKEYEGSTIISQCMCSRPAGSFRKQTWSTINKLHVDQCPDILSVIDLVLTRPAHSADCDRGFSYSKLGKSDWRSKLQNTAVTNSLTVVLQTPSELDFNPEDAVRHWNSKSTRRPNQTCGGSDSYLAIASSCQIGRVRWTSLLMYICFWCLCMCFQCIYVVGMCLMFAFCIKFVRF